MCPTCPRCGEWDRSKDVLDRIGLLRYRWCSRCKLAYDCSESELRPPLQWWRYPVWVWRHRHCWTRNRRHDWLYYGPGGDGPPTFSDRKCLACQVRD